MNRVFNTRLASTMLSTMALPIILSGAAARAQVQVQQTPPSSSAHAPTSLQNAVVLLTTTGGVDFSQYVGKMSSQIKKNWFAAMPADALAGAKGKSAVVFRIQPDGKIEHIFLEVSSGSDSLDQAALKGIRDSSPLDPLPPSFKGPYIELRFFFSYNLNANAALHEPTFDCGASAADTPQAPPFDRLELVAFLTAGGYSPYMVQSICQRGINFTPDQSLLAALRLDGLSPGLVDAVSKAKPRGIVQPSPDRLTANVQLDLAIADKRNRQSASAEEAYVRALKFAPDSAALHLASAMNLIAEHKYPEAEAQSRRSLELWPEDADAHVALAMALSLQKRDAEAVSEAREALRIFPGHKMATVELGFGLARSGQYKAAIPVLREVISFAPQMPVIYKHLGASLAHTGNFDEAVEELTLFLKTNPNDAEAHYLLGVALRGKGKADDALAQFREAARLEPGNPIYSVNVDSTNAKETASSASDSTGPRPDDGFISENVYTNTFFNFSYKFPRGWSVLSADQGKAILRFGGLFVANGDPVAQDAAEASARNAYQLLVVAKETTKDISTSLNLIQIQAFSTRFGPDLKSGEDFLKSVVEYWQHRGVTISIVEPPEQFTVAGRTFWKVKWDFGVKNSVAHEVEIVTIEKGYILLFGLAVPDASKLDDVAGTMQSLQFTDTSR